MIPQKVESLKQHFPRKWKTINILKIQGSTSTWTADTRVTPALSEEATLPIPLLLQCTFINPWKCNSSSTLSPVAPPQRSYNPLASGFLSPFPGLQPWHFTREYQVCDLSHRGVATPAGLSLVAIKWVSYKIKRIFLSSTLSKQKISTTFLTLTYNLSRNKLLLHQIVQRGSITYRIHLFFFHFSRFAALWLPLRYESESLKVEIHSIKILLMFW